MAGGAKPPRNVAAIISENGTIANKPTSTSYSGLSGDMKNVELLKIGIILMITSYLPPQQTLNKWLYTTKTLGKRERKALTIMFSLFNIPFLLLRDLLRIC